MAMSFDHAMGRYTLKIDGNPAPVQVRPKNLKDVAAMKAAAAEAEARARGLDTPAMIEQREAKEREMAQRSKMQLSARGSIIRTESENAKAKELVAKRKAEEVNTIKFRNNKK